MIDVDYREAACCGNCYYYPAFKRCGRTGIKPDMLHVCAHFMTKADAEREPTQ